MNYGDCYICKWYNDDYKIDENGNLICNCKDCHFNPDKAESEDKDTK